MKGTLLALTLFLTHYLLAQSPEIDQINARRVASARHQFITLGSWAVGNMAVSGAFINQFNGPEKYFHQMNVIWNSVNLGIAGLAYWSVMREEVEGLTLSESLRKQSNFEKSLLFNAGLDIGYVMGGLYMFERGKNRMNDRLNGFGKSVMLQGAFLFVYDVVFYIIQLKNSRALLDLVENLAIGPTGFNLRIPLEGNH